MRTLLPYLLLSCMAWGQATFALPLGPILAPESVDGFMMEDARHGHRACHKGDRAGYVADTFACCFAIDDGEPGGYGCWKYSEEKSYGVILDGPKPEPMDVLALKHKKTIAQGITIDGTTPTLPCAGTWTAKSMDGPFYCVIERWTCADKSRILLTAEDGTRHCVKF